MPHPDAFRPVVSAQLLARLGVERGMSLEACLHNTGIAAEALSNPATEIRAAQELQLVRNLLAGLAPCPGLGLDAGTRYHLSTYGIWGFALLSSPNFRSAAEIAVRYLDLSYAFTRFRLEPRGNDLMVILDDSDVPEDVRAFMVERDFAACASAAWEMRPAGFQALGAQFRGPRPAHAARYEQMCGVTPAFDAPYNGLLLSAKDLDSPLPQANPVMSRMCEEQCRQLLGKRRARTGFSGQIRDRLLRNPGEMPSLDEVAAELHLAPRSLRRRLEEEGASFRALTDEVRQALAEELLVGVRMNLAEVATRLGYAEPAAFISAFKRWNGMSPSAWRQQQGLDKAV